MKRTGHLFEFQKFLSMALSGMSYERQIKNAINQGDNEIKLFIFNDKSIDAGTSLHNINSIRIKCTLSFRITVLSTRRMWYLIDDHCRILFIIFPLFVILRFILSIILTLFLVAFAKKITLKEIDLHSSEIASKQSSKLVCLEQPNESVGQPAPLESEDNQTDSSIHNCRWAYRQYKKDENFSCKTLVIGG